MAYSDDDSSDDDTGPALPSGVLRSRGGWEDKYNIEVEHQRERLRAEGGGVDDEHDGDDAARGTKKARTHAAVNLAQFRNEEVGKGYQAKHVVRQREASSTATGVIDMSGGKFSKKKKRRKGGAPEYSPAASKRRRDHCDHGRGESDMSGTKRPSATQDVRLESYLKCKGMRDFMKDIDQILRQ